MAGGSQNIGGVGAAIPVFKSYGISDIGTADTSYLAGFYDAPAAEAALTQAGVTQTYGTADDCVAAHAFCVMKGDGATDAGDLVITVTGISITDAGVKNGADSEVIVADAKLATAATDTYYETSKKWLGQVTYTLTSSTGPNFNCSFNYGFCKYEDFGNRDFTITDVEVVGRGGASETGLDVELLCHNTTGWTYSAAGFVAGNSTVADLNTDHGTDGNDLANDTGFAWKRAELSTAVSGSGSEGFVIRITTVVNNSITYANAHVGVTF